MSNFTQRDNGNIRAIFDVSDLPPLSGGVYPLQEGIRYEIRTPILILENPIDLSNIGVGVTFDVKVNTLIYTGSGALFRGYFTGFFVLEKALILGDGTNSIWDISGDGNRQANIILVSSLTMVNFASKGLLDNIGAINFQSSQYSDCGTGLVFKNGDILVVINCPFNNSVSSNSPSIVIDGQIGTISIQSCPLIIQNGESFISFSKNSTIDGDSVINGNQFNDSLGGEFYSSDKTGSITEFGDNGGGYTTVTSVSHGLTVEQVVEITGTTNYNAIHQDIFNVTDDTFDIPIAFNGDDATGTFDTGDSNIFRDKNCYNSKNNGEDLDTNEIGKIFVNNDFEATISAQNTPVELNGGGTDFTSDKERRFEFEAAGENDGTLKYTGTLKKEFRVEGKVSLDSITGTSQELTAYIGLNGSPVINSLASSDSSRKNSLHPSDILELEQGDVLSLFAENNDSTNNLDIFIGTTLEVFSI